MPISFGTSHKVLVSNHEVRKVTYFYAAPFVDLFALLFGVAAIFSNTTRGLAVRTARVQACGPDDRRVVVVQVLAHGILKIDNLELNREDLDRRLAEIFKTRVYRWIFVDGDPDLQFSEVAEVIDAASKRVDYVAILTPSLVRQADWHNGICIEPNLPLEYYKHPPR